MLFQLNNFEGVELGSDSELKWVCHLLRLSEDWLREAVTMKVTVSIDPTLCGHIMYTELEICDRSGCDALLTNFSTKYFHYAMLVVSKQKY